MIHDAVASFTLLDVIEKATNYLVVFMMIQGSLEKAVDRCRSGEGAAAADYLDQAVAYYVGSEELTGPFYYNLAVSRCGNFDTCDASGKAPVNNVAWNEFAAMKQSLASSNCNAAATSMNKVIDHMVVPLIQGTLRYAIFLGLDGDVDDKTKGEGAIFAQAVLPYIAACDAGAAQIIFDNMKPVAGAPTVEFAAVRDALESTYGCLGISKSDIGCYEGRDETCPTGVTIVSSSGEDVVENGSAAATSSMYVWAVSAAAAAAAALLVM